MSNVATSLSEALELTKRAVEKYPHRAELDSLKATRAVAVAVTEYKRQVLELERADRGVTQQAARDLTEVIEELPFLRAFLADKKALHRLHTRQLAMEHIDNIEQHLDALVKNLEGAKTGEIREWVRKHPVLNEFRKFATKKKQPEDAYFLLFQQADAQAAPELVTTKAKDGRIFTRWRPRDFVHESKIHQTFFDRTPIVGGAIIAGNKLHTALGQLPQPNEGEDQLRILLRTSKEIASQPAKAFVSNNPVLQAVHELCKGRGLGKEAYILLFLAQDASSHGSAGNQTVEAIAPEESSKSASPQEEESANPEAATDETAIETQAEPPATEEADEVAAANTDGGDMPAPADEPADGGATHLEADEQPAGAAENAGEEVRPELLIKTTEDGRVLTRFRPSEFSDARIVFNTFGRGRTVCGAAIIEHNKLLHSFGVLPAPTAGESQIKTLLNTSHEAVAKPSLDFLARNEVLSKLHELSNSPDQPTFADVVVFIENEGGTLIPLPPIADLRDFKSPKAIHDRFHHKKVIGASIIADHKSDKPIKAAPKDKQDGGGGRPDFKRRPDAERETKRVVVLAFGRTPLKQSMLATPDIFHRMGIEWTERRRFEETVDPRRSRDQNRGGRDRPRGDLGNQGRPNQGRSNQGRPGDRGERGPREPREDRGPRADHPEKGNEQKDAGSDAPRKSNEVKTQKPAKAPEVKKPLTGWKAQLAALSESAKATTVEATTVEATTVEAATVETAAVEESKPEQTE